MTLAIIATTRMRKLLALAAGGVVLATGGTMTTLAAWQDHEYVWGGTGDTGSSGLTSTLFDLQQNTGAVDGTGFVDAESSPGGQLAFTVNAASLTPGDTVYGFMQLRAVQGSRGGTVALSGATTSPANALSGALRYGVRSAASRAACTAVGYAVNGTELVAPGTALTTGSGATTFSVPAATSSAAGTPVGLCFALTLPIGTDRAVGGLTTEPLWHFDATSN